VLPNTFHVQVDHFPPDRGLHYLASFFTVPGPAVGVLVAGACAWGLALTRRHIEVGLQHRLEHCLDFAPAIRSR